MKKTLFLLSCVASLLHAQSLQDLADGLTVPSELSSGAQQFSLPAVPEGVSIRFLGADYPSLLNAQGDVQAVLSDSYVNISFELSRGEEKVMSKDYALLIKAADALLGGNAKPQVIPDLMQWHGATGTWSIAEGTTLSDNPVSAQFAMELEEVTGFQVSVAEGDAAASISLTLDESQLALLGEEGYEISITAEGIRLLAATQKGLFWATRSVLQIAKTQGGEFPCGQVRDMPRFGLRGFMLDVARAPIPLHYLYEVVRHMAWYKMNDFQVHLNDNYIFHEEYVNKGLDPFKLTYAGFRMESNCVGEDGTALTSKDLSYSKKDFSDFIAFAKTQGVNIVPEFDTPGHALAFTRVRPDLIYQGNMSNPKRRCEMLDAANPETLKFVTSVFDEYLLEDATLGKPVFEGCTIHVGADEFYGEAEDYRSYIDGLMRHVKDRGYTPRIWGSLCSKPGETPVVTEGVELNLWNPGWAGALKSIEQGFNVINTNDGALYIVPYANYYRMDYRYKAVYENWLPNVIAKDTVPAGHPQLLGAMFAIWNDETNLRYHGQTYDDMRPMVDQSVDVLSQKMWGSAKTPRSFEEHRALVERLGHEAWDSETAFSSIYSLEEKNLTTPYDLDVPSLKPPYHLVMELELDAAEAGEEQILLSSSDGSKLYAAMEDGMVGFRRDDSLLFSFNTALPQGKKFTLELIGTIGETKLLVDGKPVETKTELKSFKTEKPDLMTTFRLPLGTVGEKFKGTIYSLSINPEQEEAPESPEVQEVSEEATEQ